MDSSMVLSSLAYLAFAYLLLQYCFAGCQNSPKKRLNGLLLASIGLAIGLLVKMRYDTAASLGGNLYSMMNVRRHSSAFEIRRAYKNLANVYHPDKNRDVGSQAMFEDLQNAYDILMDESLRDIYNRFGPASLQFDPRKDELKLVVDMALPFLFWGLSAFIFTSPVSARAARNWIAIVGIVVLAAEIVFYLTETTLPEWIVPSTLVEHEVVFYLHSAFPAFIALLAALAMSLHVDIFQTTAAVLEDVCAHNQSLLEVIQQTELMAEIAAKPSLSSSDVETVKSVRENLVGLRERMEKETEDAVRRIEDLRAASTNPGASYHWIVFVILYASVYFLQ